MKNVEKNGFYMGAERYALTKSGATNPVLTGRDKRITRIMWFYAGTVAARIRENKKLFGRTVTICDSHSHSQYSDGNVPDVKTLSIWTRKNGLDYLVVSDHFTIDHFDDVKRFRNLIPGIEVLSGEGHQHIVGVKIREKILNGKSIRDTINDIRSAGGFAIVAHPAGWNMHDYTKNRYPDFRRIGLDFGMEIGNAAANAFDYFDSTDAKAVKLWDRALTAGRRIVGFGGSDAHIEMSLGQIFNGFLQPSFRVRDIVKTMEEGNHFVSNGPFVSIAVGTKGMGGTVRARTGALRVRLRAADARGIKAVRVVSGGVVVKEMRRPPEKRLRLDVRLARARVKNYVRAEVFAEDGRRAYTNPIWIRK